MPLVALAPPGGSNDLDRYELLFRFAAGGMAEVFVARQRGEGRFLRPVAIKRMLPALAEEPKFVDMFLDEARLAALVQSPYVVPTLDCGKDEEGSPYIVMELVVGVSLSQALRGASERRRHVPPAIMAEVIAETALGLHDAHHACTPSGQPLEIVHRDVSPQNVLIGVDGRARLTDFGVARALERVSRTSTGEVKGKLSYFSPEQARMAQLDQRSDIFALGVVAWEMLTLERLFSRDSPMSALHAVLHERIPDVRELNPDIPERLALAVARALERDPAQRFQVARDFADELRAAVGRPATAPEIGAWVEEGGGPRLATFRKRIETAFAQGHEPRASLEPPEREPRHSATPPPLLDASSKPESHMVRRLEAVPEPPVQEGSRTRVVEVPVEVPAEEPVEVPAAVTPTTRHWALGAGALVTIAVLAGAGTFYLSPSPPPAAPTTAPATTPSARPTVVTSPLEAATPVASPPVTTPATEPGDGRSGAIGPGARERRPVEPERPDVAPTSRVGADRDPPRIAEPERVREPEPPHVAEPEHVTEPEHAREPEPPHVTEPEPPQATEPEPPQATEPSRPGLLGSGTGADRLRRTH